MPSGTQSGKVFRLRGKGVPNREGFGRGDQHVRVFVEVPTKLSKEQKELLEAFEELDRPEDGSPKRKGFLDKVKSLFR